jgi:hypothetical protein
MAEQNNTYQRKRYIILCKKTHPNPQNIQNLRDFSEKTSEKANSSLIYNNKPQTFNENGNTALRIKLVRKLTAFGSPKIK